jgi:hypothetical protein
MRNPGTLTLLLILASVITAVVIFGCGQDQDPIVLGSHNLPNVADNVEITGKVMTIDNGTSYATITSNDAGYLITCGDFNVQLKDIADKSDSIFLGFTEWTGSDTLDVIIEWVGYRHQFETYTLNGQVLFMEITDNITDEQFEQLSSFLNDPAKVNTITGNEDGYVMSALINDNWDEIINEISKPDKRTEFGDMICPLAEACVATKCWFGALLNPWCGGCTSIVIACNLMDAFGWW